MTVYVLNYWVLVRMLAADESACYRVSPNVHTIALTLLGTFMYVSERIQGLVDERVDSLAFVSEFMLLS